MATALRTALWLLLGGWLGSFGLFGLVIARVAFQVLPSTELAGRIVAPVLTALHLYGAVAGAALAGLAYVLGRGGLRLALPLVLAAACLFSHFVISAEISEIRDLVFGPEGSEALAARWGRLHGLSMGIYLAVSAGVVWLVALHARSDTPNEG
ncbi:MAG: hypothetical protein ACQGVC_14325 [Myxococcota bacterium]